MLGRVGSRFLTIRSVEHLRSPASWLADSAPRWLGADATLQRKWPQQRKMDELRALQTLGITLPSAAYIV